MRLRASLEIGSEDTEEFARAHKVFLHELSRQPGDVPSILEHLPPEQYLAARDHVAGVAAQAGLSFHIPRGAT